MSYRSFKHLLGETSLERKCRFIFGLGILLLVTVSFFLYGKKTEELVLNADDAERPDARRTTPSRNTISSSCSTTKEIESYLTPSLGRFEAAGRPVPITRPGCSARTSSNDPDKQPADDFERRSRARSLRQTADAASRKSGEARATSRPPMSAKR